MEISKTCCFTGHRPKGLPWGYNELDPICTLYKEKIKNSIETAIQSGYENYLSGMAEGIDIICAEAVLSLKSGYPSIKLICCIPYAEQPKYFSEQNKQRYENILALCDTKIELQKHYTHQCLLERNKYMVNHSNLLIAVYSGQSGGTKYTIDYAIKQKIALQQILLPNKETHSIDTRTVKIK